MADNTPPPIKLHLLAAEATEADIIAVFTALTGRAPTAEEIAEARADDNDERPNPKLDPPRGTASGRRWRSCGRSTGSALARCRMPAMYGSREAVEGRGLMSYAASVADVHRRAATSVDRILKGANPADLPWSSPRSSSWSPSQNRQGARPHDPAIRCWRGRIR